MWKQEGWLRRRKGIDVPLLGCKVSPIYTLNRMGGGGGGVATETLVPTRKLTLSLINTELTFCGIEGVLKLKENLFSNLSSNVAIQSTFPFSYNTLSRTNLYRITYAL